ncbi:NADP-dependent oxidoreductase [Pseudomonas chlororaphis]|uniref:Bifunctional protein: zinc-containing alcohol dehydrogenase n=1 Tax=Pseudomonas chlororaphis subsp. aureofaciens TaxID=587851 RepID=A0AAD1E8N8_9PSED|nr:NADP-dependent oxidoreductase [Pseudomonas chlororaphis]AZE31610.1 Bifunctional protein: zinc-containing alcohol dehydrogenase [Pseudomonas chlororaphis subsp. aureofaciens]
MQSVAVGAFGAAPALIKIAKPVPQAGQVLVRLQASGLNPFDWRLGDGILKDKLPHSFPLVLGVDGAGVIEATGPGVRRFKAGDQVVGQFLFGRVGEGSFADYAVIDENAVLSHYPNTLTATSAAALPTAGITALQLCQRLDLPVGSTVLIVGATGGVGSFLTQLAVMKGLRVIATATHDAAAQMRALGAGATLDYHETTLERWVNEHVPERIDGLVDLVSDATVFTAHLALVRRGGVALSTVWSAQADELDKRGITGGNFEIKATTQDLDVLVTAVAAGKLAVRIDRQISLADVPAALAANRAGGARGKTVVVM